jgi:hypothetical protein
VSISQELWKSFIEGRLHEVDAFVADSLQGPNIDDVADPVVRLIGHSEGVLEITLEALARSFLHVPHEIGLPVHGGERDHQAGIVGHFILQIDVPERNSDADILVGHGLFEPDGKMWLFGRALEMMVTLWPLIVGGVCDRGNWRLRVRVFGGGLLFVVVFEQPFQL